MDKVKRLVSANFVGHEKRGVSNVTYVYKLGSSEEYEAKFEWLDSPVDVLARIKQLMAATKLLGLQLKLSEKKSADKPRRVCLSFRVRGYGGDHV